MTTFTERKDGDKGHLDDTNRLLKHDSFYAWVSTVEELRSALQSGAKDIRIAAGVYDLDDGESLLLAYDQRIIGAGRERTVIRTKNAYAFVAPSEGALDRVVMMDMSCYLRSGSSSGGAVRAKSDFYHSGWHIERIHADGGGATADPLFDLHGMIGSYVCQCQSLRAAVGIRLGTDGFPSNAATVRECGFNLCGQALELIGGGMHRVEGCIIENNDAGISVEDCAAALIMGNWFENQGSADVHIKGTAGQARILYNLLHYHRPESTEAHIVLEGAAHPSALRDVQIIGNNGDNPSGANIGILLDANCVNTLVQGNTFADATFIQDSGTGTKMDDQNSGYGVVPSIRTQPFRSGTVGYYGGQLPAIWLQQLEGQTAPLLKAETLDGDLLFALSRGGYAVIATNEAPTNDDVGAGQVALWFDADNGKLKVWGRKKNGVTVTGEILLT